LKKTSIHKTVKLD